jgi:hypothetical protein
VVVQVVCDESDTPSSSVLRLWPGFGPRFLAGL